MEYYLPDVITSFTIHILECLITDTRKFNVYYDTYIDNKVHLLCCSWINAEVDLESVL
jgi:hypothetical protein